MTGLRRRRRLGRIVAALVLVHSGATAAPTAADDLDDAGAPTIDAPLAEALASAPTEATRVRVEIVTGDTAEALRDVALAGGSVTGSVPGELVQASVPAGRVDEITASGDAFLQLPRRVNRPAGDPFRAELGAVTSQSVAVTNAGVWHGAGLRGAVKVGIIDFFDLGLWNEAEHGPRPDAAHTFCRDTSGIPPNFCPMSQAGVNGGMGEEHGVAVAEVLKDMAPDAELYLATAGTTSDLRAAIDWFASNGVFVITRSLGAPMDGPGDGTGPLAAVVDHAATLGITWFNSAGNDAAGSYGRYTGGVAGDGYVDFDNGPGVDTTLTLSGTCIGFDGLRWNDWNKDAAATTDYRVELFDPGLGALRTPQASQVAGAPPLELVDHHPCTTSGEITLRLRRVASGGDPSPDVIELALFAGRIETGRSQAAFSAAKSVVDSRNPALVAVGAIDPPTGAAAGFYSSQGPTNDGRVKPDLASPSCLSSSIYLPATYGPGACFNGTSAAAPVAAGIAALLAGRGLARTGAPLSALTRHLVVDVGPPGPDNTTGGGALRLPPPPAASVDQRPAQYAPLGVPQRILDTRASSPTPGARIGPFAAATLIDVPIPAPPNSSEVVTAVAVSIVSVDAPTANYVQALPTMVGQLGGFANVNVPVAGRITPNFAIVPVGEGGRISLYLAAGGNAIVDLMGTFVVAPGGPVASGRFVAVDPTRVLDTRPGTGGPVPPEWTPHKPAAETAVRISGLPASASAVVVNVTATDADAAGFLRSQATGASSALGTANGNYEPGRSSGTLSIVPVGADGAIEIFTSAGTHIVADLMGWFTGPTDVPSRAGLFVPLTPGRAYDSRFGPGLHGRDSTRPISLAGPGTAVPAGAVAVTANLASDQAAAEGFLAMYPAGGVRPLVSNLNFPPSTPISNAALVRLAASGLVDAYVNRATHVIIDVNGYFTGPA